MKKLLFFVLFYCFSFNAYAYEDRSIDKFNVEIYINDDSSIEVIEKILLDFGTEEGRGIIRDIPLAYGEEDEYIELDFELLSVTDQNGNIYDYTANSYDYSYNIKVGNKDLYLSGKHWYYITYTVDNIITAFDTHDELYWNVTGNEWDLPIEYSEVSVYLPEGASFSEYFAVCYTGYFSNVFQDCIYELLSDSTVYFSTTDILDPGEGLTIAVAMEKGFIDIPAILDLNIDLEYSLLGAADVKINNELYYYVKSQDFRLRPGNYDLLIEKEGYYSYNDSFYLDSGERMDLDVSLKVTFIKKFWDIYFPIILFIVFTIVIYIYWWLYGKDPEGKGSIMPIYEIPDNLKPGEIGVLIDEEAHFHDITATIIHLAIKGYFKIIKTKTKRWFFGHKVSYSFNKLKSNADLKGYEKEVFDAIFKGTVKTVKMTTLRNRFYKDLKKIKEKLYKRAVDLSFFTKDPDKVRSKGKLWVLCAFVFWSFVVDITYVRSDGLYFLLFILVLIEIFILSKYLPKKTRKGVLCYEKVLGYKMFLDATEKDRLKTMYGPKDYSGVFEKHLPYAIAMGVEESWIEQFEGLYDMEMDWYDSTGPLTHHIFLSELMTFNKLAENSIKGPSDSSGWGGSSWSGGSSSGFGGGGFSGGGFGGGGGSSW